jgi:hypothetical protein
MYILVEHFIIAQINGCLLFIANFFALLKCYWEVGIISQIWNLGGCKLRICYSICGQDPSQMQLSMLCKAPSQWRSVLLVSQRYNLIFLLGANLWYLDYSQNNLGFGWIMLPRDSFCNGHGGGSASHKKSEEWEFLCIASRVLLLTAYCTKSSKASTQVSTLILSCALATSWARSAICLLLVVFHFSALLFVHSYIDCNVN